MNYYYIDYDSPVGILRLVAHENAIIGLWIEQQKYYMDCLEPLKNVVLIPEEIPVLTQGRVWLDAYFHGEAPDTHDLPLEPIGSDFRQNVWEELLAIPYGATSTYGTIAKNVAKKQGLASMSAQAVGGAVGHNPISILIPCHRVLGANGSLTGYAGGLEAKKFLLELEGIPYKK